MQETSEVCTLQHPCPPNKWPLTPGEARFVELDPIRAPLEAVT
jgi:hypothetical protein